jgi:hypothetical protein
MTTLHFKVLNRCLQLLFLSFVMLVMSGCGALAMLFTYKDVRKETVFRSSSSRKNYYEIKAITLSHCGCTYLSIDHFRNRDKQFHWYYNYNNQTGKIIYSYNPAKQDNDTIRLKATTSNHFTVPFDSLDKEIFLRIDTIIVQKTKGVIYQIKKQDYKGFIQQPYHYN